MSPEEPPRASSGTPDSEWHGTGDRAAMQRVVAAIIVSQGDVLVARRTRPPALKGRWEFPGGKVEPGETLQQALKRELLEELGVLVSVDAKFESPRGPWPIDDRHELHVFFATVAEGEVTLDGSHDDYAWLPVSELDTLDWLPADAGVIDALVARPIGKPESDISARG